MARASVNLASVGRQSMPTLIEPMLATSSAELPVRQAEFAFEFKWDGVRAVSYFRHGEFRLLSRNHLSINARYPELAEMGKIFGDREAILDGEIVALDENDRPSFPLLQQRIHANPHAALRLARQRPVIYVLFDVLYLDGHSTLSFSYQRRREMLEELTVFGDRWRVGPAIMGEGDSVLAAAREHHMEGVVAKRLDSMYEPGRRCPSWLKIKIIQRQEFVVGGWRTMHGSPRTIGALLLGYHYPKTGKLHYAGMLGTGFNQKSLSDIEKRLAKKTSDKSPFVERIPGACRGACDVHYVKPDVVVEAEYRRWPSDGLVQQAPFKGVRTDKSAKDVVRKNGVEIKSWRLSWRDVQSGLDPFPLLVNIPVRLFTAPRMKVFASICCTTRTNRACSAGWFPASAARGAFRNTSSKVLSSRKINMWSCRRGAEALRSGKKTARSTLPILSTLSDIDPIYFETPYYLAPQPAAVKSYRLLVEAMNKTKRLRLQNL